MGRNIVKAKLDIIFKRLFADERNSDILHAFISDILDIPYDSINKIAIQNPELIPYGADEKFSRLDLKLEVNDKLINVEMQINDDGYFRDRALYYWSRLFTSELKEGENYSLLKQSISINIINFNMFECTDFHSAFVIMEENRHELLSDKCAIHFFELKKINKKPNPSNKKELWMQLINAESEEELEMLSDTKVPAIEKAVNVIIDMSNDSKIREEARIREKALHDKATALKTATDRGIAEGMKIGMKKGRAEGRAEGIAEIIAKLRAKGFTEDEIQEFLK
ncbi:MAG: Rpn family recombination-promoting nuclease/putative transposase [Monoglobales bacterium]